MGGRSTQTGHSFVVSVMSDGRSQGGCEGISPDLIHPVADGVLSSVYVPLPVAVRSSSVVRLLFMRGGGGGVEVDGHHYPEKLTGWSALLVLG